MTRKNNKKDMTVTEQIEAIAEDFCKSCLEADALGTNEDPDKAWEWLERNYCQNCPLNEL